MSEKTPTRPGSQWATGKRRTLTPKYEAPGYAQGARTRGAKAVTPVSQQSVLERSRNVR